MENKKTKIISIVAIVALALTVVTATYAYFQAQTGEGSQTDIKINANTVDTFTFATGNPISFTLDQDNFASGKGNITGSTFASALLTANNKTNTATEHYYLYLNIESNTFTYSINESTPEIIMTVTDSGGNEVTNISTLNHVIVTGANDTQVSGYDITNKSGLITLFNNRKITTTSSKEEKWNIKVTFVNYDASQNANAGKSMSAKVMIQKEEVKPLLSDYVKSLYTGTQGENSIYYHDSTLTNGAGDNSYRYAGGDYVLTEAGKATGATMMIGYNNTVTTALIDFYCNGTKQYVGYGCSTSHYYLIKGDTTQYQTYKETINKAVEKGYLTKDNVKNFVCFGSTTSPCPTENLYRIIGVFGNNVKLIKYDYAKSSLLGTDGDYKGTETPEASYYKGSLTTINTYYWNYKNNTSINNGNGSNEWSTSLFNKTNLNTNYLNNIGTTWSNMIENTTWKVSGHTTSFVTPKAMYTAEITNATKTYGPSNGTSKIGLMYASDYGFAAAPSAWTSKMSDYYSSAITSINWVYMGLYEWTIMPDSSDSSDLFSLYINGSVSRGSARSGFGVRPVLYLKASVPYAGGTGTKDLPITLVV